MPPAMCDMLATSTMYMGLTLTYASSFQMLRGKLQFDTDYLQAYFYRSFKVGFAARFRMTTIFNPKNT